MSSQTKTVTNSFQGGWVQRHVDLVLELPEPGQEYRYEDIVRHPEKFPSVRNDIPMAFRHRFSKLKEEGIVHKTEYYYNTEESNGYHLWETDPEWYELAEKVREKQETYPCGHSAGFRTIESGEVFECLYEFCGETPERFGPEEVERVEF